MDAAERREIRRHNKWKRRLSYRVIKRVDALNPESVSFRNFPMKRPEAVVSVIKTDKGTGIGVAICSARDSFNPIIGKNIAAKRAAIAIENQLDVLPIRQSELGIPETWTLKQANRVLKYAKTFECKGLFRPQEEDNFDRSFEKAMGA